jgi:uncharacterized protein (TIGR02246 family)
MSNSLRRTRTPSSALGSADDIEQQFYEALREGDVEKLMALWSDDEEIVCVQPEGARVVGATAIRASFEAMFARGAINVRAENVRRVHTNASAMHNVVEHVQLMTPEGPRSGFLVATNVYMKSIEGWRLVAHHASPGANGERREVVEARPVLH